MVLNLPQHTLFWIKRSIDKRYLYVNPLHDFWARTVITDLWNRLQNEQERNRSLTEDVRRLRAGINNMERDFNRSSCALAISHGHSIERSNQLELKTRRRRGHSAPATCGRDSFVYEPWNRAKNCAWLLSTWFDKKNIPYSISMQGPISECLGD